MLIESVESKNAFDGNFLDDIREMALKKVIDIEKEEKEILLM
jgi:hypothetical protein